MRPYPQAEAALRRLHRRFAKVSRRLDRRSRAGRRTWWALLIATVFIGALGGYALAAPGSSAWGR